MITGNKLVNGLVDNLNELALPKMASALQAIYKSERYNLLDHISFLNVYFGARAQLARTFSPSVTEF